MKLFQTDDDADLARRDLDESAGGIPMMTCSFDGVLATMTGAARPGDKRR
ncbi:MAG: hypothetical protein FWD57_08590 [Polyangiaceae bacterium]|nr:hypothetical protein [Polyangiaceae bacterium]